MQATPIWETLISAALCALASTARPNNAVSAHGGLMHSLLRLAPMLLLTGVADSSCAPGDL